ncbi:GIY-YIG nuclease family protein [Candidatus Dojkabacteria bacterium]|nr:GIY-YIG nuclease family protein [Candidatus Dojkabacteria bacterium]
MYYVYILRSEALPEQIYVGFTSDLDKRLKEHNEGLSKHTSKFRPWKVETYIAFSDRKLALKFEKYLKVGSGNAFMKKRLLK